MELKIHRFNYIQLNFIFKRSNINLKNVIKSSKLRFE